VGILDKVRKAGIIDKSKGRKPLRSVVSKKVAGCKRIQERHVVNDATVGPWKVFEAYPEDLPQTAEALKEWLVENGYHEEFGGGSFDENIHNYGLRHQFRIPVMKKSTVQRTPTAAICIESIGVSLTEGKRYEVKDMQDDMIVIVDDDGVESEFLRERFNWSN